MNKGHMHKAIHANQLSAGAPRHVVINENIMRVYAHCETAERALLIAQKETKRKGVPFLVMKATHTVRPADDENELEVVKL